MIKDDCDKHDDDNCDDDCYDNTCCNFFLSGFSSADTEDSQDSRGREGTTFYSTLPLYQFHPLTNIETFICNFA